MPDNPVQMLKKVGAVRPAFSFAFLSFQQSAFSSQLLAVSF
jgi:hypothetical protein